MNIRGLSLTDLAPDGEKTRNFAIDRAVRNIHGLIDLLDEWKSFSCPEALGDRHRLLRRRRDDELFVLS